MYFQALKNGHGRFIGFITGNIAGIIFETEIQKQQGNQPLGERFKQNNLNQTY